MKFARMFCFALFLASLTGLGHAQSDTQASDNSAKSDMKDAGRSTKHAAKKTGSAVKKTTKKEPTP
jgi:hypothetical protein